MEFLFIGSVFGDQVIFERADWKLVSESRTNEKKQCIQLLGRFLVRIYRQLLLLSLFTLYYA